ncbi:hypothetical protein MKZ38_000201 [Zalerion maritima]|uniref:Uncharacterized protein n=1 Tax=Zalerion maritima TaxID=339359 RepID=A0AAD5RRS9_9PEZI|nr:hypothetical protein MKZ38_000201 [Zalerion maritima]
MIGKLDFKAYDPSKKKAPKKASTKRTRTIHNAAPVKMGHQNKPQGKQPIPATTKERLPRSLGDDTLEGGYELGAQSYEPSMHTEQSDHRDQDSTIAIDNEPASSIYHQCCGNTRVATIPAPPVPRDLLNLQDYTTSTSQQAFPLDEALAPFDATLPFLEGNDNYHSDTPSSLLESDDTPQSALEEMLWLDQKDNAPGLFPENAVPVPPPSDLPDSAENVTARPSVESVPSEPSPGAVSAASDLGQGGDCVSKPSLAATADLGPRTGDVTIEFMKATLAAKTEPRVAPPIPKVPRPSKARLSLETEVGDDDVHSQERSSLAEQNSPASPEIWETRRSRMDYGDGSNEVTFVRSRKGQRPSSAEQNRPASSQNFEAQQSKI